MPKRIYKKIKLGLDKLDIIQSANDLIASYDAQGYKLTLRQLYYQFIAQDLFPSSWIDPQSGTKNNQKNYKKLGDILGDARMSGRVDWNAIEDRTRELNARSHWDTPADIIETCSLAFNLDAWKDQRHRVEVWVEKDALEGIVKQAAHAWDCAAFSCRGYGSLSSLWEAAQRLMKYVVAGQKPVILHLGDHDPSGCDMSRDIDERLNDFLETDWLYDQMGKEGITKTTVGDIRRHVMARHGDEPGGTEKILTVKRIALTMDQVQTYNPPPNPAKSTDARYRKYQAEHGDESWELDALEPSMLDNLIQTEIQKLLDADKYNARVDAEADHRKRLKVASEHWDKGLSDHVATLDKVKGKGKKR